MAIHWYVLRVANKEEFVRDNLLVRIKQAGLEDKIPQVLVPTEKVTEIKRQKKKTFERKCYPGYILVEMEICDDVLLLIRETPGVGDFLGADLQPAPLPPDEVARVLKSMDDTTEEPTTVVNFHVGEKVRIKEGFFENFEGEIEDINPQKGKLSVVVSIFNRSTPVDLEFWQVESL